MIPPMMATRGAQTAPAVEAVYAGIDWISCTLPRFSANWAGWCDTCRHIVEEIAEEGYELEARTLNGYRGLAAGGSFCGVRDDGAYLQLTSYRADLYFERYYRYDLGVSRLDCQATVRFVRHQDDLGELYYHSAVGANSGLSDGRKRRIWYMSSYDGGYTLYIGAPTSEQRGRIYNKEVQSADPLFHRCWRYEAVFRNDMASRWAIYLSDRWDEHIDTCARIVGQWYIGRGVTVPYFFDGAPITLPLFTEVPSDAERKLTWLKDQVRPALRWLMKHGFEDEAAEALGLVGDLNGDLTDSTERIWRFLYE